jgi:hypothetical protein
MRRIMLVVTVALVMAAMTLAMAMPAFAGMGGAPPSHSCGLGKEVAHAALEDTTGPGASEAARTPPSEFGCTGPG